MKTNPEAVYETTEPKGDLFSKKHGEVPCRNPARIPHMINLMHICWAQEDSTDMRMGQLLRNAARLGGWTSDDLFNCEDEIFAKGFLTLIRMAQEGGEG